VFTSRTSRYLSRMTELLMVVHVCLSFGDRDIDVQKIDT
jgi:hypothetical protein